MGRWFPIINSLVLSLRPLHIILLSFLATAPLHTPYVCGEAAASEFADTTMVLPQVSVTAIKGGKEAEKAEAVTCLNRREIERLNIVNIKQVSEIVPNFYMPQYGSRMTSSVYVRGLGTRIDQPVVGLNIDNVPIINKDNFDFDLSDIERIEILRGPQNILYGRNTMGGLINIHTLSPFTFEGIRILAEYASHNSYKGSVGLYKRMTPRIGMALNAYATGTDGYFRNSYNNSHVGRERQWSGRWKTICRAGDSFIVENTASVSHSVQNGYPYKSVKTSQIAYNDTCFYKRLTVTDGLTFNGRINNIDISGIGSFQYINDNMTLDQDFLPQDYFTLTQKRHEWAFTADLVAKGKAGKHYNWLAGTFGYIRQTHMDAPVTFFDYGLTHLIEENANKINPQYPIRWDNRELYLGSRFTMPSSGGSLYHESTATFGRFTATVGLRWDWERAEIRYNSDSESTYSIYRTTDKGEEIFSPAIPVNVHESGTLSKTFAQLLPKLTLSYILPSGNGNIFLSFTKGYKAGGYNTQMFSDVLQQRIMAKIGLDQRYDVKDIISYDPEKTWNYEIGTHLTLADRKLAIDAALFWIECRDQQLTMFPEGAITGRIMANAGKSRSRGAEISATYHLTPEITGNLAYGFTDARFTEFNNGRTSFNGKHVPYAPINTLFAGINYTRNFKSGFVQRISADINCRGIGKIYWDETNSISQPFYAIADASIRAWHDDISAEIWINNFTATQYATFYFVSIGNAFLQKGNGMQLGLTLRYDLPLL